MGISRIVTVAKFERNLHFTLNDFGRGSSGKSNNDVKLKKTSPAKKVDLQKPLHDRIWTSNEVPAGMIRCDLIPEEIIKNGKSKNLEAAQTLVENRSKILVRIIPILSCSIPYVIGLMAAGVSYFLGNASAAITISNIGCFMMIPGYFIGTVVQRQKIEVLNLYVCEKTGVVSLRLSKMSRSDQTAKNIVHIPPNETNFEIMRDFTDSKILQTPSEGTWDKLAEKLNPHDMPKTVQKTPKYYIMLKDLDCGHYLGPLEKVCCISGVNVLKAIEAHDIGYIKPILEKSEFGKALLDISASSNRRR